MKKLFAFFLLLLTATTVNASGVIGSMIDPTARANAATADGKAVAAQTTANTAVSNAATAQTTANTALAAFPTGAVYDFAGTSCPTGSLQVPASPTDISRTTYATLFAAIGTTWGVGDGSTTFGMVYIPLNYATLAAYGNVGTLTVGQVISHYHGLTAYPTTGGTSWSFGNVGSSSVAYQTDSTGGAANLAAGIRFLKCVKL